MTAGRAGMIALILLLGGVGAVSWWSDARETAGMDFYQMWIGARMARETTDFYAPATRARMGEAYLREAVEERSSRKRIIVAEYRRNLEVLSTPFLYTLYAPFGRDYDRDLLLFQAIVFVSFVAWVAIFSRLFGYGAAGTLLFLGFLLLAFEPVKSDVRVANMNHVMLLLLACGAALTRARRFPAAGAILAAATLIKPYIIAVIPLTYAFWASRRRWTDLRQHLIGSAVGGAAATVAAMIYFRSPAIWLEWLAAFRAIPDSMIPLEIGNVGFAPLVRRATGANVSWPLMAASFIVAAVVAARRKPGPAADVPVIALGCVVFQLGSPLVWVHHLLLGVPLAMYLLRPASARPLRVHGRHLAGALVLACLAVEPWAQALPSVAHVAVVVNAGLVLGLAAALRDVAGSAAGVTPRPESRAEPASP